MLQIQSFRYLFIFVAGLLAASGTNAAQQHARSDDRAQLPQAIRQMIEFDESVKARMRGGSDEERVQKAWQIVAEAMLRREQNQPRFEQMLHDAAWVMIECNAKEDATAVFQSLETSAKDSAWVWEARLQIARLLMNTAPKQALEKAKQAKQDINSPGSTASDRDVQWSVEILSEAMSLTGDYAGAVAERSAFLESSRSAKVEPADRLALVRLIAIDLWRLGKHEEGRRIVQGFFDKYPEHEQKSGDQQNTLLWAAWTDRDLGKVKDEATLSFQKAIWHNPVYAVQPETMSCASNLGTVLGNRRDKAEQIRVFEEALARFVAKEVSWRSLAEQERFQEASELYVQLTYELLANYSTARRWDDIIRIGQETIKRVPNADAVPRVHHVMNQARAALQKPTDPPSKP